MKILSISHRSRWRPIQARCLHINATVLSQDSTGMFATATFRSLGIRPAIAAAVQAAFPNIKFPTESQAKLIPAVMGGYDVLLKDDTGTGKSLGIMVALLNKPRSQAPRYKSGKVMQRPCITSLVIVPHRDLAYQLQYWISRLADAPTTFSSPPLSSVCQVLVRDSTTTLSSRISTLREDPPHILIGTPNALVEVLMTDREALQLESLSAVVVDEVDYLIESVPRKDSKKMMEKARRKIDRHPGATRQLLDVIYASRVRASKGVVDHAAEESRSQRNVSSLPQLIMSSATLRNHLKLWLYNGSGWLRKDKLQKLMNSRNDQRITHKTEALLRGDKTMGREDESGDEAGTTREDGNRVTHHVLVVSGSGDTANIEGTVREEGCGNSEEIVSTEDMGGSITPATVFNSQEASNGPGIEQKLTEKFANTRSVLKPSKLEAIAESFAMDVPAIALLVLPANAPLLHTVHELRGLGIDAHGLDLATEERGRRHLLNGGVEGVEENPTLLVSTLATSRGLDLPELTHVFILGILEGRAVDGRTLDSYLHLAGRVGRFGRRGKVITVLDRNEVERMEKILETLGIGTDLKLKK